MTPRASRARPVAVATYVYCVAHSGAPIKLGRLPRGLPGTGPVHLLDAGGSLWLVVADAPRAEYDAAAIERGLSDLNWVSMRAAAHEAVVERVSALATIVPMKLFTLFATEERAVAHILKMRRSIERIVRRVAGRDEWGVRVLFDARRAERLARDGARRAALPTTGTAFLRRKHEKHVETGKRLADAREEGEHVFSVLETNADDTCIRPPIRAELKNRLILDAVFLVPRKRQAKFRRAAEQLARKLSKAGYDFTLSGPWPPYHFVGMDR